MCAHKSTLGDLADAWGFLMPVYAGQLLYALAQLTSAHFPLGLGVGVLGRLSTMSVLKIEILRILGISPDLQEIAPHWLGVDSQLGQITDQFHPACSWVCVSSRVLTLCLYP